MGQNRYIVNTVLIIFIIFYWKLFGAISSSVFLVSLSILILSLIIALFINKNNFRKNKYPE